MKHCAHVIKLIKFNHVIKFRAQIHAKIKHYKNYVV